jgi:hypothetical protein
MPHYPGNVQFRTVSEVTMRVTKVYVLVGTFLGLAALGATGAKGAELDTVRLRHGPVSLHSERSVAGDCGNCRGGCPDRYSCYSLYGAYGPYGGPAYWTRYTISGWRFYR